MLAAAGQVLGDRVASSKLDMNDARALNAKLIKRQYFGAARDGRSALLRGLTPFKGVCQAGWSRFNARAAVPRLILE